MANQNQTLVLAIESLVLQSRTLDLDAKQRVLALLPKLTEEQLTTMKNVFETEKKELEQIVEQELTAWSQFHAALSHIAEETKLKLAAS